ncbi:LysM peptidoglycan-binding domain-containing protein [Paludibacterium purpuratum]|uniref:Transglycosylase-like protein with SLT domain n=1 Tax=Paludibacterium purpuratum TaxID=1144873 RepID=A0A4R7AZF3_9NEIS|nr:LysM domain-containing protein [Paludibacterium purpuratum]TDR73799.1 transglycosylase-like protein with SLT domain [Paludibacterium purpuratum]
MSDLYSLLYCKKQKEYRESSIKPYSLVKLPIEKSAGELAGNSRVGGDASADTQSKVVDKIVEVCVRYGLSFRETAFVLLMVKVESGFNPDAAAGTTSAAGLAQFTNGTAKDAKGMSKQWLGFELDILLPKDRFDAEKGAYSAVLAYMKCKSKAKLVDVTSYEKYIYIFHHEGWNKKVDKTTATSLDAYKISNEKIIPFLDCVESALKKEKKVSFSLKDSKGDPVSNQAYLVGQEVGASKADPARASSGSQVKWSKGVTDGAGKTAPIDLKGVGEVVFAIINNSALNFFLGEDQVGKREVHVVKRGETLSKIAKQNNTTVDELAKINAIKDRNKLPEGATLELPKINYTSRSPDVSMLSGALAKMGLVDGAMLDIVEYFKSHVVLPRNSKTHANDTISIKAAPAKTVPATQNNKMAKHKTKKDEKSVKDTAVKASDAVVKLDFSLDVAKPELVSSYTKDMIKTIMKTIGLDEAIITSGIRTTERQAKTMYDNIESYGVDSQLKLYAQPGREVVGCYAKLKKENTEKRQIISAMKEKIEELLTNGHRVSKHCVTEDFYKKLNVIDISHKRMRSSKRKAFEAEIKKLHTSGKISKFITPGMKGGEPAYHLEIPQP